MVTKQQRSMETVQEALKHRKLHSLEDWRVYVYPCIYTTHRIRQYIVEMFLPHLYRFQMKALQENKTTIKTQVFVRSEYISYTDENMNLC